MGNEYGEVRMLNEFHLRSALRGLPFEVRKDGLSDLQQRYSTEGLPGAKL